MGTKTNEFFGGPSADPGASVSRFSAKNSTSISRAGNFYFSPPPFLGSKRKNTTTKKNDFRQKQEIGSESFLNDVPTLPAPCVCMVL